MTPPADRTPEALSVALGEARAQVERQHAAVAQARAATADGAKAFGVFARRNAADVRVVEGARDEQARRHRAWRDAREGARRAATDFRDTLADWLGETRTGEEDVARLDAAFPILLFPVRLETRFARRIDPDGAGGEELLVRIYPDEIAADVHEAELTDIERALGERYWTDGWASTGELDAWRVLVKRLGAARAAWVALAMTPTNIDRRPTDPPMFGAVPSREGAWTRAARARVLPDRWVVVCHRGGVEVARAVGRPVTDPLALTISPTADDTDAADVIDLGDGLTIDREVLWTVDFTEAESLGMAVRVSLDGLNPDDGFDRIIAVGVKGSLSPADAAARVGDLLDAHHYTRGFAIVAQGTPTNNTAADAAGYPPPDPDAAASFATERGAPLAEPDTDGRALADALGIGRAPLDHVAGASRREQRHARAMNGALWPTTWGYYLEQMLDPILSRDHVAEVEAYFLDHVRGRGPLPLFRVGATPYGVLPVSSLARWRPTSVRRGLRAMLPGILARLLPRWDARTRGVPRVGRTNDPDRDLLDILAQDASAREVWVRAVFGAEFQRNLAWFLDADVTRWLDQQRTLRTALAGVFGAAKADPRVYELVFDDDAHRFRHPFVADAPLSESAPLDFNYLRWLRTASITELRAERVPAGVARPEALLYRIARHALLQWYRSASVDLGIKHGVAIAADHREPELVGIVAGTEQTPTVWQRLETPIPAVTGAESVGEYLHSAATLQRAADAGRRVTALSGAAVARAGAATEAKPIAAYMAHLETLESVPTAELDRLFSETLDCCAHRLDAWITSLATERLGAMRAKTPAGVHVGAFGWIEGLRPIRARRTRVANRPDDSRITVQASSGGFIHAPSMDHAGAAAVLRNAYLTRSGADQARYAVDLSSTRVRTARWLLAGAREGQPLAAMLGYRFERGLHEGHRPLDLDRFIEPLRRLYPLPVVKDATSTDAAESISARDVVNGTLLRDAWRDGTIPFGTDPELVFTGADAANERAAIELELAALDETLDAVADLLTAESVYHLVRGASAGAGASLDALAQGVRPPDPDISRTPRGGTALTHRVAVVLGGTPIASPGWTAIADTPRAAAEPHLDRWVGALLGQPNEVRCTVTVADPTIADPDRRRTVNVTFDQLALHPLDVLALLPNADATAASATVVPHGDGDAAKGSELDRRIATAALAGAPQRGDVIIDYRRDPTWPASRRSLAELLEVARVIESLVRAARPLRPADLATPERSTEHPTVLLTGETDGRITVAETALGNARAALDLAVAAIPVVAPGDPEPDLAPVRNALRAAAMFGIAAAYPAITHTALTDAKALIDARVAALPAPGGPLADLLPLRDALRRAKRLGVPVEPASVADAASTAGREATVAAAASASASLGTRIVTAGVAAREALLVTARSVSAELASRINAAASAPDANRKAQAIFGRAFTVITRFQLAESAELQSAIDFGPTLIGDDEVKRRWLAQAARVREPLDRWRRLELYTSCLGTAPPLFDVAQLPHANPAQWVGVPFANEAERPPSGRVSLALVRADTPQAADPWAGLLIDEWTETIPAAQETTGIAFHYDDPGAEAPQTLLLAVPPTAAATWDLPSLLDTLHETLDLARVRAVHGELLGELGQLLPAAFLAANAANETVSTDLTRARARAVQMVFQA